MNDDEEMFIPTETQNLRTARYWGLAVFVAIALIILIASFIRAF